MSIWTGDNFSAIETRTLSFLGADDLSTAETVVDKLMLLSYTVALDSIEIYLSGLISFLFFHFIIKRPKIIYLSSIRRELII